MSRRKRYSVHIPASPLSPVLPIHPSPVDTHSFTASNPSSPLINQYEARGIGASSRESSSFYRIPPTGLDQLSLDSLSHNSSNIKLLLIGDAGVGKTAMILGYCNELPTKSQVKIMSAASTPVKGRSNYNQNTEIGNLQRNNSRSTKKTIEMKKRYSLNDYEELFNKRQKYNGVMFGKNSSNDEIIGQIPEDETDDSDEFVLDTRSTIGVDIKTTIINIDNRFFKCIMWDTAGQERYRNAMIPILYKDSNGIILTYDICNLESFQSCFNHWLKEALDNFDEQDLQQVRFYLIGNKIDLYKERKVTHEQVLDAISSMEREYNISISGNFEITCKWPHVVERTMNMIIKDLVENGCYENMEAASGQTPSLDTTPNSTNTSTEANSDNESDHKTLRFRNSNSQKKDSSTKASKIDISKPKNNNNNNNNLASSSSCCV